MSQNKQRSLNNENWKFKQETKDNWLPAKIPGTVHTDLLANKVIEDPFSETMKNNCNGLKTKIGITQHRLSSQNRN